MRRKAVLAVCLGITVLLAPLYLLFLRDGLSEQPRVPDTVRIGTIPGPMSAPLWLALHEGYFSAEDIDLKASTFQSGSAALDWLLKGKLEFATCAEYVVALNGFSHPEIRVLAVLTTAQVTDVVANKDAGISRPADLRGKRIGIPRGTHIDYYLARFLALHRVNTEEVQIVHTPPAEQERALKENRVDAVVAYDPYLGRIKSAAGSNGIVWTLRDHDFYWLLVSTVPVLDQHPDLGERMLRSLVRAEGVFETDMQKVKTVLEPTLGRDPRAAYGWDRYDFDICLPQPLLSVMEEEARWVLKTGLVEADRVPNYLNFLAFSPLERVKAGGVTLIQ